MDGAEWIPELVSYTYWDRKEHFLYENDTYTTWILFAVEDGEFAWRIGDRSGRAGFGDIVVCPPQIIFHRKTLTPLTFHVIAFHFPFTRDSAATEWLAGCMLHLPPTERLREDYRQLKRDPAIPGVPPHRHKRKQHYFSDLWFMMNDQYPWAEASDTAQGGDKLMRQAASRLREHAGGPVRIKQIAGEFGLTPVQLIRRFKAAYRLNPLQYLTEIRIKKACSLLAETDWKLDDIAGHCGYENGYYLSRVFSKQMGASPSAFRKQSRF